MNTRIPTTMYAHQLKRESTGSSMTDTVCPTCSCGWRGIAIPEYEDYQMTEVLRQEREHITQSQLTAKEPA